MGQKEHGSFVSTKVQIMIVQNELCPSWPIKLTVPANLVHTIDNLF